jgi:hypothetical protein
MALDLFWGHGVDGASVTLRLERGGAVGHRSQREIPEHHLLLFIEQHILRFDIAVDLLVLVGVVQSSRHLGNVANHGWQGYGTPEWVQVVQAAMRGIFHDQAERAFPGDDVWMAQLVAQLGLVQEQVNHLLARLAVAEQPGMRELDRHYQAGTLSGTCQSGGPNDLA